MEKDVLLINGEGEGPVKEKTLGLDLDVKEVLNELQARGGGALVFFQLLKKIGVLVAVPNEFKFFFDLNDQIGH